MGKSYLTKRDQRLSRTAEEVKGRSVLGLSKADAGWLVFCYVVSFLILRFDIRRHGVSFQHRMATGKAALIAVPFAVVIALLVKITSRSEGSYLTSLSLDDTDRSTNEPRVNDNDKRF